MVYCDVNTQSTGPIGRLFLFVAKWTFSGSPVIYESSKWTEVVTLVDEDTVAKMLVSTGNNTIHSANPMKLFCRLLAQQWRLLRDTNYLNCWGGEYSSPNTSYESEFYGDVVDWSSCRKAPRRDWFSSSSLCWANSQTHHTSFGHSAHQVVGLEAVRRQDGISCRTTQSGWWIDRKDV